MQNETKACAPGRVLVTGASSGIGASIATALLEEGWNVVGMGRSSLPFSHPNLSFVKADLLDIESLAAAMNEVGHINALVHAAGVLRVGGIGKQNLADGQQMWRLHLQAVVQLVEHFGPRLPDGGRIVMLGSRTARGAANRGQYAASKAAVVGLARSYAIELATRQITVNVIAPGATDTPMLRDPSRSAVAPRVPPMGRFIQPEEIAALTAFLLSDLARSITGQEIVVCAGASL